MRPSRKYKIFSLFTPSVTITVDGDPGDWAVVFPIVTDRTGDEIPELDITNCYVTDDGANLYFRMDLIAGPAKASYCVFIDTDRNSATGYSIGDIGADYNMLNGFLHKWTGKWQKVKAIDFAYSSELRILEWSIAFVDIAKSAGQPVDIIFGASALSTDYAPDTGHVTYLGVPARKPVKGDVFLVEKLALLTPYIATIRMIDRSILRRSSFPSRISAARDKFVSRIG